MDEKGLIFTILMVASIIIIGLLVGMIFMSVSYRGKIKEMDEKRKNGVIEEAGERFSNGEKLDENGETVVSYNKGDTVLSVNKTLQAKKGGEFKPGQYTLLSSDGAIEFKIRVGGFVRQFNHGDTIVIGDGDEITAVSNNIILR